MHRFRSWTLDPPEWRTQRNRLLPIEGGDGSTLSLDFTSGVLDPRLQFTRGTNATFINSQGYVEWANSNMFRNTVWTSTSLPTGWLANPSNTGTITYNGDGTISCNASSQTAWIYPNFPYVETASGLSYICSVRVVSISASVTVNAIVSSGNLTALEYFIDGVSKLASDSVTGPCVVSVRVTASGTQWYPRLGAGVQGVNVSFNLVMSEPHAHPGVAPRAYMANTSTSAANFNTPRFDYNLTTLQVNGLLLEGQTVNYALSLDATISGWWGRQNINGSGAAGALALGQTGADNVSNSAARITTAATALPVNMFIGGTSNGAGSTRTFSVWLRGVGSQTTASIGIVSNGTPGTPTGVSSQIIGPGSVVTATSGQTAFAVVTGLSTTKWTRIGISRTDTIGTFDAFRIYIGDARSGSNIASGVSVDVFIPQAESGIGMSSTIPTGASQVTRNQDQMRLANLTGVNFNTQQGTMYIAGTWNTDATTAAFPRSIRFMGSSQSMAMITSGKRLYGNAPTAGGAAYFEASDLLTINPEAFKFAFTLLTLPSPVNAISHVGLKGVVTTITPSPAGVIQTPTTLDFLYGAAVTDYPSMTISVIKYWPFYRTAAEIASLTA